MLKYSISLLLYYLKFKSLPIPIISITHSPTQKKILMPLRLATILTNVDNKSVTSEWICSTDSQRNSVEVVYTEVLVLYI